MSELWALTGSFWRLPIEVHWVESLAQVRVGAGAALTRKMREVALERLKLIGTMRDEGIEIVMWVPRPKLETVAQQFYGTDPEDVIEWLPAREKVPPTSDFQPPDDFILEYCKSQYAWIRDPLLADIVWMSFIKFMMHWLLNEHRTVNLFFAKMDALCLRNNWKVLAAKDERDRKKEIEPRDYLNPDVNSMVRRGVGNFLVTGEATGFDGKSKTASYTLEVQETPEWGRMVRKIERLKVVERGGGTGYWNALVSQLRRQLPRALRAYEFFLKEAARPFSDVSRGRYDRHTGKYLGFTPGGFKVGSFTPKAATQSWAPDRKMFTSVATGRRGKDVGAPEVVQDQMRDLRQEPGDVRESGPESLPGSTDG